MKERKMNRINESERPAPKFKPGDRVIIVGYQDGLNSMKQRVGQFAVVDHMQTGEKYYWYYIGDEYGWREDWLEFEPEIDMNGFEELFQ